MGILTVWNPCLPCILLEKEVCLGPAGERLLYSQCLLAFVILVMGKGIVGI
jgi:hypothetical protein